MEGREDDNENMIDIWYVEIIYHKKNQFYIIGTIGTYDFFRLRRKKPSKTSLK